MIEPKIVLPLSAQVCFPDIYGVRRYMERRGYVMKGSFGGACFARRELYSVGPADLPAEPMPPPFRVWIIKSDPALIASL